MGKIVWLFIVTFALIASFVPLEPVALSLVIFLLFVFISVALFQHLEETHWIDRFSPLVVVGIGIVAFIAYAGLFLAWGNSSLNLQVWRIIPHLIFMYVGVYLFVVTLSSFMAGATRQQPSRFYRPVIVISVICYGAMLFLSF